jgi:hypothetical protein
MPVLLYRQARVRTHRRRCRMAGSSSAPGVAAQSLQPDLLAKELYITAEYGVGLVYASAVCENLGPGAAHGPFSIAISVDLRNPDDDTVRASYVENFQVPADVTLAGGPPVFTQELVRPQAESDVAAAPIHVGTPFQTQYVTGRMAVPLFFLDTPPYTVYTAEFLVDPYFEVPDHNRVNNIYSWSGGKHFWFISQEARERQGPFVIERA